MAIRRIDHIGVLVRDLDATLKAWEEKLGVPMGPDRLERFESEAAKVAFIRVGEEGNTLLNLTEPKSGELRAVLDRRGDCLHHLSFLVGDVEAAMADARARGAGIDLSSLGPEQEPRTAGDDPNHRWFFLDAAEPFGGAVVEITQNARHAAL